MATDEDWMKRALELATLASSLDEVPVGAIVVFDGKIVGRGKNCREADKNPTGHAEMVAIQEASHKLKRWRLNGCTLFVTLEPCLMCSGAAVLARVDRVVFGALDPKAGAVQSLYQVLSDSRLNHQPGVAGGVLDSECGELLSQFFKRQREKV